MPAKAPSSESSTSSRSIWSAGATPVPPTTIATCDTIGIASLPLPDSIASVSVSPGSCSVSAGLLTRTQQFCSSRGPPYSVH